MTMEIHHSKQHATYSNTLMRQEGSRGLTSREEIFKEFQASGCHSYNGGDFTTTAVLGHHVSQWGWRAYRWLLRQSRKVLDRSASLRKSFHPLQPEGLGQAGLGLCYQKEN